MPSSAAAVEFAGPRQVRVAAVALPEPGPDEVFVTTHFSGISGGRELLAYRGEIDPGVPLDDPVAARGTSSPRLTGCPPTAFGSSRPGATWRPCLRPVPTCATAAGPRPSASATGWSARGCWSCSTHWAASPTTGSRSTSPSSDRVVHHGVLNRTASPASTVALTSSCCPAGGNVRHGLRRGPGRCPAGRRVAGWQPASPRQRRSRGSGPRPGRYPGPRRRTRPAGQRRGVAGRRGAGGGAAEALRCRDGATPRQHSSRPSRS